MKQIIPFKKELPFKTKVTEITSISLERDITIGEDSIVSGTFHISGEYKMNEGSIAREKFNFDLPFDITLDSRYDMTTALVDIDNFTYDIVNEEALNVNIDLYVDAKYKEEDINPEKIDNLDLFDMPDIKEVPTENTIKDLLEEKEERVTSKNDVKEDKVDKKDDIVDVKENIYEDIRDVKEDTKVDKIVKEEVKKDKIEDRSDNITNDLFSNIDSKETYTTYYVYIVKEEDTLEGIINKYEITKEDFEMYNEIEGIKPGDKVIIPKRSE